MVISGIDEKYSVFQLKIENIFTYFSVLNLLKPFSDSFRYLHLLFQLVFISSPSGVSSPVTHGRHGTKLSVFSVINAWDAVFTRAFPPRAAEKWEPFCFGSFVKLVYCPNWWFVGVSSEADWIVYRVMYIQLFIYNAKCIYAVYTYISYDKL